ncbi:MAG: hypothetical protein H6732_05300 [Alphaproteobacteria bacterium]|nr:hypothetical protein [Alphaproteobacteria bacterium]
MVVYRWDLDRTYLDTDIFTVRGMLRSAFEAAADKRTIPGADTLLRGLLDADEGARATILSGSPVQMRAVLEEKLALDGIRFDSLVLKDNLRNLRRGRFRAVRGQLGYKLPHLLAMHADEGGTGPEYLFGDDAEVDALVYALYADAVAGRVDSQGVERVLRAGGAYEDQIATALGALARMTPTDVVAGIFIHVDRGVPLRTFALLGERVRVVFSWYQAALALWTEGRLAPSGVAAVAEAVDRAGDLGAVRLAALTQDAVRRRLVAPEAARALVTSEAALERVRDEVHTALDLLGADLPPSVPVTTDYLGFLARAEAFA